MFATPSKDKNHSSDTYIQPQLEVGAPDDEYEKEANDVADKVMRMPEGDQMPKMSTGNESIQRMRMDEDSIKMSDSNEGKIQMMMDYPAKIQKMSDGNKGAMAAPQKVEQGINSSIGSGQPLPANTQADLGPKMNADLSSVKIHTDSNSVQMNKEIGAKAFTNGNDIYFNQGQYNPQSSQGKHLLAHELTHTIQQNGRTSNKIQRQSDPGTAFGSVNPLDLKFKTIVPYSGTGPGGWRAVSVIVSFTYTSWTGIFTASYYRRQEIAMEIGVPIKNFLGDVSLATAQLASTAAMNLAAQSVAQAGLLGTPAAVTTMRSSTQAALSLSIPGARVSAPISPGLVPIRL